MPLIDCDNIPCVSSILMFVLILKDRATILIREQGAERYQPKQGYIARMDCEHSLRY